MQISTFESHSASFRNELLMCAFALSPVHSTRRISAQIRSNIASGVVMEFDIRVTELGVLNSLSRAGAAAIYTLRKPQESQ